MAEVKTTNVIISVGNIDITSDHKNFSSLNLKRTVSDAADQFTLSILDDSAFTIETALLKGENEVSITYIDDDGNTYKKLSGSVLKIKNSFIDNRNMLTLEGYVSLNVSQKFDARSASWNTFPTFDWEDITGIHQLNETPSDATMPSSIVDLFGALNIIGSDLTSFAESIGGYEYGTNSSIVGALLKNNLVLDNSTGEYLIDTTNTPVKLDKKKRGVYRQTGSITIPINPGKLISILLFGGKFKDIFPEKDITDEYSETLREQTYGNIFCLQQLIKMFGDIDPASSRYKKGNWDDGLTAVSDELVQSRESNLTFIYNKVLGKCLKIKEGKTYSNYKLNFKPQSNGDVIVDLDYLDATKQAKSDPVAQYIYYGAFEPIKNFGSMTSFSADINVLTSMITSGQNTNESSDISSLNLVTGKTESVSVVTKEEVDESINTQRALWGQLKFSLANGTHTDSAASITSTFKQAQAQSYKASATITGFNKLEPMDIISIAVAPVNINGVLQLHHTSGNYFILSVEDSIEDGVFSTRLELIKNINSKGATAISTSSNSVITTDVVQTSTTDTAVDWKDTLTKVPTATTTTVNSSTTQSTEKKENNNISTIIKTIVSTILQKKE